MYIDILCRWNSRINLTAIRDEEEIVTRHFGESLFAAAHLFSDKENDVQAGGATATVADVGSGAGFPGIPMKLWAPQIALTLIESNHKKATFLREVTRALILTNVNVRNARAEEVQEKFDLVTLRAVEQFKKILPVAVDLVAPSGRLALLVSKSQVDGAASVVGLSWRQPLSVPRSSARVLLIGNRYRSN
jgi:16S rRNA (guanine527-N7)-methyltransferase